MSWVLGSLEGAAERFIVSNRPYPDFGLTVYEDVLPGGGSLSGVHSALLHAQHETVAVAACDLPFLTQAYWETLLRYREDAPLVIVRGRGGYLEPLAALYSRSLLELIEARFKAEDYSLQRLASHAEAVILDAQELGFAERLFLNANYLTDLPPEA